MMNRIPLEEGDSIAAGQLRIVVSRYFIDDPREGSLVLVLSEAERAPRDLWYVLVPGEETRMWYGEMLLETTRVLAEAE